MMFKVHNCLAPRNIQDMFPKVSQKHIHNTRQCSNLYVSYCRTKQKSMTFKIQGPQVWNLLDKNIKLFKSVNAFKLRLKKLIINSY